jgi:predicted nucleotidyltransferase
MSVEKDAKSTLESKEAIVERFGWLGKLVGEAHPGIKQVNLFGSHQSGKATENSDIDVAVFIDESWFSATSELLASIGAALASKNLSTEKDKPGSIHINLAEDTHIKTPGISPWYQGMSAGVKIFERQNPSPFLGVAEAKVKSRAEQEVVKAKEQKTPLGLVYIELEKLFQTFANAVVEEENIAKAEELLNEAKLLAEQNDVSWSTLPAGWSVMQQKLAALQETK